MYEIILFPTDGSDHAATALPHAIEAARRYDATLDVLVATAESETIESDGEEIARAAAERAAAADLNVNTAVIAGRPVDVIRDYVPDRGVDIVVMGTHGRRGLDRFVLGSVTETMLRSLSVPVLVVPSSSTQSDENA